ncbi:MAG: RNA methyltransferase [Candidatus Electryonea clarkiae]|nr:RNA methyltransferase [Candidatus Electryonea clarkiae]MDP8286375.1 RNA methyltransferase [Candidatus Electryonea clarkiae]
MNKEIEVTPLWQNVVTFQLIKIPIHKPLDFMKKESNSTMTNQSKEFSEIQISLKTLRKLGKKKFRQQAGCYLLEGVSAVVDAVKMGAPVQLVVYDHRGKDKKSFNEALDNITGNNIPTRTVEPDDLKMMSGLDTTPSMIAVVSKPEDSRPDLPLPPGLVLALDRVNNPGNVGSLIRSAAYFGALEVWLGRETAELFNPKTLRAAMTAQLVIKVCPDVDLGAILPVAKESGSRIIAAVIEDGSEPEFLKEPHKSTILILGNEAHGLSSGLLQLADKRVAIPGIGRIDSLNVAMAGTVLLDRMLRQ